MKYIKRIILIVIILISVSISSIYAATGIVTSDGIRIRREPNTESDILAILNKSATVEILEDVGDWYKIRYTELGNYEGYMSKQFIQAQGEVTISTPTPSPEVTPTPTPTQTQEPVQTTEPEPVNTQLSLGDKVTVANLNVYILPTVSSSIKDTVKKNSTVTVQEIAGNFAYIKYNNKYGWVRVNMLQEMA